MNKFKKFFTCALAGTMILSLASCGSSGSSTAATADTAAASTSVAAEAEAGAESTAAESAAPAAEGTYATPETEWEIASGIYNTEETDEELYELAKEEGSVTIYSISSRTPKVIEAFNEKYPGVVAESYDIKTNELLEKVSREHEAGQHVADVVHVKDEDGTIWNEYIPNKVFYNYKPADILSHIDDAYTATQTPLYIEMTQFFYNTEAYPDGSPITNIWQLTDPEWNGRIVMQNPLDNTSWNAWVTGFTIGDVPAQLEAAYKELYGEDLVLSAGCENAGYELWKRIYDNKPIFAASSDECAEAIGAKGQENPPVGFSASSKIRKNKDNDWVLGASNLYPTVGIPAVNTLYVVEGCEHPNAAKLLIRFMMGGVDGDLSGYEPFNTLGGWPVRDDIDPAEGSTPLSEYNVATADAEELYMNVQNVRDFLTMLG
ncbi:MAG: extracellular solute-binding protein [Lachnospiraceae bacterium]|nr:extracellular solute-binding protein [Lachnospiraceae bacterium]